MKSEARARFTDTSFAFVGGHGVGTIYHDRPLIHFNHDFDTFPTVYKVRKLICLV